MKLEGLHQSFRSDPRTSSGPCRAPLPLVAALQTDVSPVPEEPLCAHQSTTDRGSAVNDYTIREEPLKSHTFQFKTHKPSELGPD